MKVPYYVFTWVVVMGIVTSAPAQSTPRTTDTTDQVLRPGRLVESASPNTGMAIPDWDENASGDAGRPPQPEIAHQDDSNDKLSEFADKINGRATQPPTITSVSASRDNTPHNAGGESELKPIENRKFESTEITDESNAEANAATLIPRPRVADPSARSDGQVVPRTAVDAPWYRHPIIALIVVVGVIVGVAMVFRRYVPSGRMIPMQAVRVVGRAPISAKHSIALLHVGQRLLVVGMTADRVSTLSEITDPQEVSLLLGASGDANVSADVFGAQLADQIGQFGMGGADGSDGAIDLEDRSLLKETKGQLQSLMRKLRSLRAA